MSAYDKRKVMSVVCPLCSAEPGDRCKNASTGGTAQRLHTARKAIVYPEYGTRANGNPKQGQAGIPNPITQRKTLRNAVIAAAMDHAGQNGPCTVDIYSVRVQALQDACRGLKLHREQHPKAKG